MVSYLVGEMGYEIKYIYVFIYAKQIQEGWNRK